jgi:hypothetical protein
MPEPTLVEKLLEEPCLIVDILPEQVPAEHGSRYAAIEGYFLRAERIRPLRRRYAEILLKLNCYGPMAVSFDYGDSWEKDPDPERFAARMENLAGWDALQAVFERQNVLMTLDSCDTYMTVYGQDAPLLDRLRRLAESEGLFVWRP